MPARPALRARWMRPPRSGLELDRHDMIEADQLLFDRQQRLDFISGNLVLEVNLRHVAVLDGLADKRRLETAEEQPGNQQAHPNHEAEQADDIDRGKLAKTLLPEFAEIRQHTDREEGEHEEDHAEHVGFTGSRR